LISLASSEILNSKPPDPNPSVDFNGLAAAAGYRHLHEFSVLADFEARIPALLQQEGPVFATLHIEKGALSPEFNYRRLDDPAKREAFKAALQNHCTGAGRAVSGSARR
jgi:hypothetical protein